MGKEQLIEEAIRLGMGHFSENGALIVETGQHTGRSANHRYLVKHPELEHSVDWGKTNKGLEVDFSEKFFHALEKQISESPNYSMTGYVGCFPIQVTSFSPWHVAFAHNMFSEEPIEAVSEQFDVGETIQILHHPFGKVSDLGIEHDSDTLILLDLVQRKVGIIGTAYAGEIKKSAFSVCNFLLPAHGILPMHSSANCQADGHNSSILFGLSGTGKTTLSADPDRALIGDDEIIWTDNGLSNLEGGCYAKLIDLSQENEPEIYKAVNQFGSIMENICYDKDTRKVDYTDSSKTENTRGSYDISALSNVFDQTRESSDPKTIVFLTADAFGALPAVARLDFYQAQYHFMSGYTAKVAGTEIGVTEPTAAFSACFGAPFMPRHPSVYAKLLAEKAENSKASIWLLNTGWVGGYRDGKRFPISVSRELLKMIQSGELDKQPMVKHPIFGFEVPTMCPGVEAKWLEIPSGPQVMSLAEKFVKAFDQFAEHVEPNVVFKGGPIFVADMGKTSPRPGVSPSL